VWHPEFAPVAALNLGNVLVAMGDTDGARAAFQRAAGSGHPDAAPSAVQQLRRLG
jgi:predicted negative regulator of RcsB-dependent stress response